MSQLHTCSSLRLCISTLTLESWYHFHLHSYVLVSGLLWSQLPNPANFYLNFPELVLTLPRYLSDSLPSVYQKNAISWFASFSHLFFLEWLLSTVLTSDPIWTGFNHLVESMLELGIICLFSFNVFTKASFVL